MTRTDNNTNRIFVFNISTATRLRDHGVHSLAGEDVLLQSINDFCKIYVSMFLMILGTLFNVLSILVLQRAAFKRTPTSVFLQYLAVIDVLVLYNGLNRQFIEGMLDYSIRHVDEHLCKFHCWSSSFAPDISAWTLVAVTMERLISIAWPHKIKTVCTKTTTRVTMISICVVAMLSNLPVLIFFGDEKEIDETGNITILNRCVPYPQHVSFFTDIWYWINNAKLLLLPSAILIFSSIVIIYLVIRSRQRVNILQFKSSGNGRSKRLATSYGVDKTHSSIPSHEGKFHQRGSAYSMKNKHPMTISRKEISVAITLVVINAVFLVSNMPVNVYFLGYLYFFHCKICPAKSLMFTVSLLAMYTSNAINFLLYCATGSKFRRELHLMFLSLLKIKNKTV